jgi:tetratricopeptide (TPR) repeat protein
VYVAILQSGLAVVAAEQGLYEEAETFHRQALALIRRLDGDTGSRWGAQVRADFGLTLYHMGRLAEARTLLEEAYTTRLEILSPDHVDTLLAQTSLALVARDEGNMAVARELGSAALQSLERLGSAGDFQAARALVLLADLDLEAGRPGEAEAKARRALQPLDRPVAPSHWRVAEARTALAAARIAQGLPHDREALAQALETLEGQAGQQSRPTRDAIRRLRLARSSHQVS